MIETATLITDEEIVELGLELYRKALVRREDEPITDPRGQPIGWLLDTRIPMLEGDMFRHVGVALASKMIARDVRQVAGYGYGSFPMVCSLLSTNAQPEFAGGFVRERRKPHGRRRLVEGPVDKAQPIVLLDDILNSGRSAAKAVVMLRNEGFNVVGLMTLFSFTWGGGKKRIEDEGVWVESLLDLNLREKSGVGVGSDSAAS